MINHIPTELNNFQAICNSCGKHNKVDWLKELPFPREGIPQKGGEWVLQKIPITCLHCGNEITIELPFTEIKGKVVLYGDEAFREFRDENACLYTFSLSGCDQKIEDEINSRIIQMKKRLMPEVDPYSWKIHMKIIWSGQHRSKEPAFSSWRQETTIQLMNELKELLSDKRIIKFNTMFMFGKKSSSGNIVEITRNEVYGYLLIQVISQIIKLKAKPIIRLDSHKELNSHHTKHAWATEEFNKIRHTNLYAYIAKGRFIDEPEFICPGSKPLAEISDVISFFVARYHYCKIHGKTPDVNLKYLGDVEYSNLEEKTEDFIYARANYYPWNLNYPKLSGG